MSIAVIVLKDSYNGKQGLSHWDYHFFFLSSFNSALNAEAREEMRRRTMDH